MEAAGETEREAFVGIKKQLEVKQYVHNKNALKTSRMKSWREMCVCVCACVCVCVCNYMVLRERETERQTDRQSL